MHELLTKINQGIKEHETEMNRISQELKAVQEQLQGLYPIVEFPVRLNDQDWILVFRKNKLVVFRPTDFRQNPRPVDSLPFPWRATIHAHLPAYLEKVAKAVNAHVDDVAKDLEERDEQKWNMKNGPKTKGMY